MISADELRKLRGHKQDRQLQAVAILQDRVTLREKSETSCRSLRQVKGLITTGANGTFKCPAIVQSYEPCEPRDCRHKFS